MYCGLGCDPAIQKALVALGAAHLASSDEATALRAMPHSSLPRLMRKYPFSPQYLSIKNGSAATTLSSAISGRYGTAPLQLRKNEQKWTRYGL